MCNISERPRGVDLKVAVHPNRPTIFLPKLRSCSIFVLLRRPGGDRRGDRRFTEAFRSPASRRENLTAKRSRAEMAPQQLEKIESRRGNGSVSQASKPQDLVYGRAADRALRLTRRGGGPGAAKLQKKAPNALKSRNAESKSPLPFLRPNARWFGLRDFA
jgi:hypothetical protein